MKHIKKLSTGKAAIFDVISDTIGELLDSITSLFKKEEETS